MDSLPSYRQLKEQHPLRPLQQHFIEQSRQIVRKILNGTDSRLLLIVGPCSIHDLDSAKEFALRLKELAQSVSKEFFLIMRAYCEKPRTTFGWKGFLYDPFLDGSCEIRKGIESTRQLLSELASLEVPTATEFLDPFTAFYYEDLITWGSIGARTASSQIHRNIASSFSMPIGFKNGVAGNISAAVDGALAARYPHTFMRICENGTPTISRSSGNPDTHIVLRGGEMGPNYDPLSVSQALIKLEEARLVPSLLIDCAHHNSNKKHDQQPIVFQSIVHQILEGNTNIRGLMLESHLQGGGQPLTNPPSKLRYGVSITDPCLDWQSTAQLIRWGAEHLHRQLEIAEAAQANSLTTK